jgi:hypothetical protein
LRARYGDDRLGRSCPVARRLVEAGVSLVTVIFGGGTRTRTTWSTREIGCFRRSTGRLHALLADLSDRGLLNLRWSPGRAEFGARRSSMGTALRAGSLGPRLQHCPGGWRRERGQVFGRATTWPGDPTDNPSTFPNFVATIYHGPGIRRRTPRSSMRLGRPQHIVAGRPLLNLF